MKPAKKITELLLLISMLPALVNSQEGWFVQQSNASTNLYSIYFIDEMTGFAAGGRNFLSTTNGGLHWSVSSIDYPNAQIFDIYFADSKTGFAVGTDHPVNSHAMIASTINGGSSWGYDIYGNITTFRSVSFMDRNTGVVVGGNGFLSGVILKTNDLGKSWYFIDCPSPYQLEKVSSVADGTYMAGGYSGVMIRSTNAGNNWIRLQLSFNQRIVFAERTDILYNNSRIGNL